MAEKLTFDEPPDFADRDAVLDHQVESQRRFASPSAPFDEPAARELAAVAHDRTADPEAAASNHVMLTGGERWRDRLAEITVPTLVVHGAEDPLFPPGHGEALAAEIPGARLLLLPRTGHELPRRTWDTVVPAVLAHTAPAPST